MPGGADGKRQAWKGYLPVSLRIHSLSPKEQWPNLLKGLRRLRLRTVQAEAPGPPKVGRTFGLEAHLDTAMSDRVQGGLTLNLPRTPVRPEQIPYGARAARLLRPPRQRHREPCTAGRRARANDLSAASALSARPTVTISFALSDSILRSISPMSKPIVSMSKSSSTLDSACNCSARSRSSQEAISASRLSASMNARFWASERCSSRLVGTSLHPRRLHASRRPWPAITFRSRSIKSGTLNPKLSMLCAI